MDILLRHQFTSVVLPAILNHDGKRDENICHGGLCRRQSVQDDVPIDFINPFSPISPASATTGGGSLPIVETGGVFDS
ncbi:hypothetical protein Rhopal_007583-T1 [Rhodotorula paludigena]|uniref:Uncharacterized protein n=1 Tax=Rhodotorula paludigena TaxID=86838 RepID=A0AAV5GPI2_9BASI|nr:hypothetical protein Rhopal_007583-T1 [Rhodotorula paludigena]